MQLRAQALAQRMLGDERLELRDQRPRGARARARPRSRSSPRDQAQLLEPLDVDARERLELEVRERPAAPQALAVPQHPGRAFRVPLLERSPPLGQQPLEAVQVELAGLDVHEVAGRAREAGPSRRRAPCAAATRGPRRRGAPPPAGPRPTAPRSGDRGRRPGRPAAAGSPAARAASGRRARACPRSRGPRADRGCGSRCVAWSRDPLTRSPDQQ